MVSVRSKLSRSWSHRLAMLKTMVTQLVQHERVETTVPRAKELRRLADQLSALGEKRGGGRDAWKLPWAPPPARTPAPHTCSHFSRSIRMVTLGKEGTLAARRQAAAVLRTREALEKVFGELAARYAVRVGGYTRVLRTRDRRGDCAPMAFIEVLLAFAFFRTSALNINHS